MYNVATQEISVTSHSLAPASSAKSRPSLEACKSHARMTLRLHSPTKLRRADRGSKKAGVREAANEVFFIY